MRKIFLIILFLFLYAPSAFATAYGKVNSGNSLYNKGDYEKAIEKYRDAKISAPADYTIDFDIGDAFLKEGKYEEAENEYNKAASSKNPKIKERSLYNLGNSAVLRQKEDDAIEYYKKALDVNPNDINAKYNIEFLKLMKANPAAVKNPREGKEGQGKEKQKAKELQENVEKGKEEKKQGMTKEDAERISQYYSDAEKQSAEKRKMKSPQFPKTEEDW